MPIEKNTFFLNVAKIKQNYEIVLEAKTIQNLLNYLEEHEKTEGEFSLNGFGLSHFKVWWMARKYLKIWNQIERSESVFDKENFILLFLALEGEDKLKAYERFFSEFESYMAAFNKLDILEFKKIGYWSGENKANNRYPEVKDFVISRAYEDQSTIAKYLKSGTRISIISPGTSTCRICGMPNGNSDLGDGKYIWPEGLEHYITEHNVRLPQEFEKHVNSDWQPINISKLWPGEWYIESGWWISQKKKNR